MIAKTVAVLAMAGSAAAFAPTMSMGATRRQALAGAAAAGVALPLAANSRPRGFDQKAPIVEIFDARGCEVKSHKEYQGVYNGDMEDEQCVKVTMSTIYVSEATAAKKRQEFVGGKASGINVQQISGVKKLQWY